MDDLNPPWEGFRGQVLKTIDDIFVSRLSRTKHSGAAHEDTVRSYREGEGEEPIVVERIKFSQS